MASMSDRRAAGSGSLLKVVPGASLGTVFDGCDDVAYALLAAAAAAILPLGAVVFGGRGDAWGRKRTVRTCVGRVLPLEFEDDRAAQEDGAGHDRHGLVGGA